MERIILKISNAEDRATVANVLYKNGYTVREITVSNGKTNRKAIEAKQEEQNA
jgi:2-keto-3-deoxy-6-phosphogluconate aldolase